MRRVALAVCLPLLAAVLFGSWNAPNPSTPDEMFFDEHGESALSLLQKSAKIHVEKDGDSAQKVNKSIVAERPPEGLAICQAQCAGTVCPDPNIGSNQMLSCMQACEFRLHGEGAAECGFKCYRNGQSGCSLSYGGFTANMCAYCSDWPTSTQAQKTAFLTNADCVLGCNVALPTTTTTTTTMSPCQKQCAGTLCPDPYIGSNQMLSCAQACEFRMHGESAEICGYKCNRNGQSGCSLSYGGFTANMCAYCNDWKTGTEAQKQAFVTNADCVLGCSVEL